MKMAVLIPMSRPAESSKGPPELPGLMAASSDQVLDDTALVGGQGAVERRDDPHRQGPVETEGVADGEHLLPDLMARAEEHGRRATTHPMRSTARSWAWLGRARAVVAPVARFHLGRGPRHRS